MGVRVLDDIKEGHACLYDSVTMTAFGPLFEDGGHAEDFLTWVAEHAWGDVRMLSDEALTRRFNEWVELTEASADEQRKVDQQIAAEEDRRAEVSRTGPGWVTL